MSGERVRVNGLQLSCMKACGAYLRREARPLTQPGTWSSAVDRIGLDRPRVSRVQVPGVPLPSARGEGQHTTLERARALLPLAPRLAGRGMHGTCARQFRRPKNITRANLEHQVPGWVRGRTRPN